MLDLTPSCLLEANGYITKQKAGRHNLYTLREKVCIKDASGRPHAVATWDYLPASVRDAVADLKHVMVTGDFGGAKIVNIENLTVNIVNMGDNSINVNVNDQGFSKLPVEMQRILMEMRSKAK